MKRRRRRPWILTALTLLLALACGPWNLAVYWQRGMCVSIGNAELFVVRLTESPASSFACIAEFGPEYGPAWPPVVGMRFFGSLPFLASLWIPLFGLGAWTALAWRSYVRGQRSAGCCSTCSYDLTGNESGICPECGAAFPGPAQPVQP